MHYSRADSIKQRCENPNNKSYKIYKGRNKLGSGLYDVCLALDKVPGYFTGAQIDRIDNDGDYTLKHPKHGTRVWYDSEERPCKGNLRWVSQQDNLMNKTHSISLKKLKSTPRQKVNIKKALSIRGYDINDFELEYICRDNTDNRLYIIV